MMEDKRKRLRRTMLFLPGNNPGILQNAALFGADCVILDLEDSVSPSEKLAARNLVRHALESVEFGDVEKVVRVNATTTPFFRQDLEMIRARPDAIMLPKVNSAQDIIDFDNLASSIEEEEGIQNGSTGLVPIIETAQGVLNVWEIARASSRIVALNFGAEDFSASVGCQRTKEGDEIFHARNATVLAAAAIGADAIDTVFIDVDDEKGLIEDTQLAKKLGMTGKAVIHPRQLDPIHLVFAPTAKEIEHAKRVVAALREAKEKGSGVASLDRRMIDAPVAARAKRVLELAVAMNLIDDNDEKDKKEIQGGGA